MGKRTNDAAINTFIARKAEIDEMLIRLQALSADHFNVASEDVTWGHVGDLEYYAENLRRVTDAAFREGEHAA
jgi:hypothetical protein